MQVLETNILDTRLFSCKTSKLDYIIKLEPSDEKAHYFRYNVSFPLLHQIKKASKNSPFLALAVLQVKPKPHLFFPELIDQ